MTRVRALQNTLLHTEDLLIAIAAGQAAVVQCRRPPHLGTRAGTSRSPVDHPQSPTYKAIRIFWTEFLRFSQSSSSRGHPFLEASVAMTWKILHLWSRMETVRQMRSCWIFRLNSSTMLGVFAHHHLWETREQPRNCPPLFLNPSLLTSNLVPLGDLILKWTPVGTRNRAVCTPPVVFGNSLWPLGPPLSALSCL